MKRPIAKLAVKYIHGLNILVGEVSLDLLTIDISRLVPPFLDENGSIYHPLLCIHQYLQYIETKTQHKNLHCTMNLFGEAQH